ncbi:tetratricopeptide (TPR) repeat protein [Dysgonomonas sp. PH5-45]|uniref:tetratricopeptide repeat protein n=1 Tax=unclassified Dysgonomonas TaxID=2630389 RepID=UPI002473A60A|nr:MULTISPECIES: hypothetical protein [unclassified Dysgonomonas]MDH6354393.1 tetratricopeptide (TPR) repeat protein [Dysgonomonas sp. PH5-45]MDH6387292.1 tetratricopeptide (TPR) repeat protein [Dysgonomonas sp. PH5-37]
MRFVLHVLLLTYLFISPTMTSAQEVKFCTTLAEEYIQKEKYQEAVEYSTKKIISSPHFTVPYHYCGVAYFYMDKFNLSIGAFTKLIELDPVSVVYSNRGGVYSAIGYDELANKDFEEAIRLDSANYVSYCNRLATYINNRLFDEAKNDLYKAELYGCPQETVFHNWSDYFWVQKELNSSIHYAYEGLRINPNNMDLHYRKLRILEKKGLPLTSSCKEIIWRGKNQLKKRPGSANIYWYMGDAYAKLRNKTESERYYKKALLLFTEKIMQYPQSYVFLFCRGMVYKGLGNDKLAYKDFEAAYMLNADYPYLELQ